MVCVHTYSESDNTLLRFGHLKFSNIAAGRKWRRWIRRPRKHHLEPKMKGIG